MDRSGLLLNLLMDLDHFEFATNVANPLLLLVGLTRIELELETQCSQGKSTDV